MTTIHEKDNKYWVITKGAPERIAAISNDGKLEAEIKTQEERMAQAGLRVIGFGGKEIDKLPDEMSPDNIEKDLQFIGLVGMIDPPREEAKKAISECKDAGIVTVMITGDHPLTAASIARQIGIIDKEDQKVVTGKELEEKKNFCGRTVKRSGYMQGYRLNRS